MLLKSARAAPGYELVRETWKATRRTRGDFETFWRTSVHDGVVAGTASKVKAVAVKPEDLAPRRPPADGRRRGAGAGLPARPDDPGRPVRQQRLAPGAAQAAHQADLGQRRAAQPDDGRAARAGDGPGGRAPLPGADACEAPVWIEPGQADDTVTVHLGYGRTRAGRVGNGAGFNAYALRTSDAPWSAPGCEVARDRPDPRRWPRRSSTARSTGSRRRAAAAAERDLVREATLADFLKHPHFAPRRSTGIAARGDRGPARRRRATRSTPTTSTTATPGGWRST